MIRTALAPRPVRAGVTLAAVAGIALLAGCAPATDGADEGTAPESDSGTDDADVVSYADGEYSGQGSYSTPETVETITVTVSLEGDVITAVSVTGDPQRPESERYQGEFIGGIEEVVVGKDIDEITVSRVAGSSLTSSGFNEAIETIKAQAAA